MKTILAVTVLLAMATIAQAKDINGFKTGNEFYELATSEHASNIGRITFFVNGMLDALSVTNMICTPNGVTVRQVRDFLTKYYEDHPDHRHFFVSDVLLYAMPDAWQCDPDPKEILYDRGMDAKKI